MDANRRESFLEPLMDTYWHLSSRVGLFNRGWTQMDTDINNKLLKNWAANAAHGQGRVGRRVAPESTATALSDRNDGRQCFSQPSPIGINP
jgi:hypothetical protein